MGGDRGRDTGALPRHRYAFVAAPSHQCVADRNRRLGPESGLRFACSPCTESWRRHWSCFQFGVTLAADVGNRRPVAVPGESASSARMSWGPLRLIARHDWHPVSDASIKERLARYHAAWSLFLSSPIVGVGPGHSIEVGRRLRAPTIGCPCGYAAVLPPSNSGCWASWCSSASFVAYAGTVKAARCATVDRRSTLTLVGFWVPGDRRHSARVPRRGQGAAWRSCCSLPAFRGDSQDPDDRGIARGHPAFAELADAPRRVRPIPRVS